jgi:phosphoribosylformylglycinamidine cyclo-ligase
MAIEISKDFWDVPWIFKLVKKKGNIEDHEMYRTLNMGIGMVLVIERRYADKALHMLREGGLRSHVIGRVMKGNRQVEII